jgi:tetratricopeptide (TPR) repeat protein
VADVELLRGQIAFHSGDMPKAVKHFEQAVALLPESVAARAQLASAYMENGDNARHIKTLDQARRLAAVTAEDYLFLGRAEAIYDPEKGLKLLETAVRKRPSMLAQLAHAEVLLALARDRGNADMAQRAAQQADAVKQLLGDNPVALRLAVEARTVALYGYKLTGHNSQYEATIKLTRPDAEALKRFPRYPYALPMCWQFYRAIGEQDTLLKDLQNSSYAAEEYLLTLYRRCEFKAAQSVADQNKDKVLPVYSFLVLMELPDRRKGAPQLYEKLAKGAGVPGWDQVTNQAILLLQGKWEESQAICRGYRKQGLSSPIKNAELQRTVDYLSGDLSADRYLKAAGESRVDQTNAHFFIGLTLLAQGNRPAALEHFRQAVQTGAFNYYHYELSWALQGRLEQDRTWPRWIRNQE